MNTNQSLKNLKVATVLVNWRQAQRTLEAVYALDAQTVQSTIIVVDNGSGDDSVQILATLLPKNALLIIRDTNGGFGVGCNEGIKEAISLGVDYIWLINNDATAKVDCLEQMLGVSLKSVDVGIVGATIKDPSNIIADHSGTVLNGLSFECRNTLLDEDLNNEKYVWITGACMLISVPVLKKVGMFDENYFMYWEDADLCSRFRAEGYTLKIARKAIVFHEAGTSSDHMRLRRFEWHYRSQIRWVKKNYRWKNFGIIIISMRHIIKSMLNRDLPRFLMSLKLSIKID